MRATDLLGLLGRTVAYYPNMVKHFKSVTATVLFCQLFYWHDKAHSELGIYKTTEEITEETGLSYKEQLTARKHLIALGVLIETHKRLEHKIYYKINLDRVNELLESHLENSPPSQRETGGTTNSNSGESLNGSSLVSKITTEITTENTNNTSDKSLVVDDVAIDQPKQTEENIITPVKPSKSTKNNIPYQKIVDIYNTVTSGCFKCCLKLDTKRKSNIQKCWNLSFNGRLPFQNLSFWEGYFNDCLENKFWQGENDRNWKADIEFLTRIDKVLKVLEGE